jgi:hypothetical protein
MVFENPQVKVGQNWFFGFFYNRSVKGSPTTYPPVLSLKKRESLNTENKIAFHTIYSWRQ